MIRSCSGDLQDEFKKWHSELIPSCFCVCGDKIVIPDMLDCPDQVLSPYAVLLNIRIVLLAFSFFVVLDI